MWVQAMGPGSGFTVSTGAMGQANAPSVGASKYIVGGDVSFVPGKWEHVVIPFGALNISTQGQVFRFYLTGAAGATPPDLVFGRIAFTQRVDTPTPTPTPPASPLLLYDPQSGSPANGFFDNSWGTGEVTTYNNTSPLRSGAYSVKVVLPPFTNFSLSDWGDPVSTTGYKALDVWLQAASNTIHIATQIDRAAGGNGNVNAEQYLVGGGSFTPNQWQHVQIPLSALSACNTAISEVHMLGGSTNPASPPPFYFDTISLLPGTDSNCPGSPTSTPTQPPATATPTPSAGASPTPTPTSAPSATLTPLPTLGASPTPGAKLGDLNGDGKVDIFDLSVLLTNWNTAQSTSDINHDGIVNVIDLSIMLSHWGT